MTVEGSTEYFQSQLKGALSVFRPPEDHEVLFLYSELLRKPHIPLNRCIKDNNSVISDVVAGDLFIVGFCAGSYTDLSREQLKYYSRKYWNPETFLVNEKGKVIVISRDIIPNRDYLKSTIDDILDDDEEVSQRKFEHRKGR